MRSNRISKFGKFIVVIMTLVMILGMLPNLAFAETESNLGKVRVIVENTTFLEETAAWTGTLVDTFVDLTDDSTVMSCVVDALDTVNATQKGAESNYISEINGLAAFDGGGESGWMGTLNDWFTSEGFGAFTVQNGKLTADDEIRIMYTTNGYGEDLGGSWGNSDKTVKDVSFSVGTLNTTFDKDTHTYTLTLPEKTTEVKVTPTASNRNYQVKTYLGTQAEGTEYKRTVNVPVKTGDVITVVCGDKSWPTMNNNTGDAQTYTFNVVVTQSSATAWDGTTITEPKKDTNDVYQIGTGEELAWCISTYNEGTPVTGVLTNDIDLNDKAWIATATAKYNAFKLDGQNHKITGLNATNGLIAKANNGSVIKNLTVYGKVSSETERVGGIVGSMSNNVTLENCKNYATVNGKKYVGGVAGYLSAGSNMSITVKNCANYGTVTGTGEDVGGVIGYISFSGSSCTFTECYNTADVTGTKYTGGLCGYADKNIKFTNCYNTGAVSGTDVVGGLFGYVKGSSTKVFSSASNCYSSGAVSGTGSNVYPLCGQTNTAGPGSYGLSMTDTYYISGSKTDKWGGTAVTEAQLKSAADLDATYFKSVCGDYPALVWQSDVTAHAKDTGVITKPTCTEGGYTTYTCPTCSITYKADFKKALDHDYCTHDIFSTCDNCQVEGTNLVRTCRRDGCTVTKSDPLITYTITLPTETVGYTVASASGYATTVATGGTYAFKVTIASEYKKGTDFAVKVNDKPISEEGGVYTITNVTENKAITVTGVVPKINADKGFTVTAPAGSTITAGKFHTYYKYDFVEPLESGTTGDGKVYAIFPIPSGIESFFRVQNPNGVTYWDFNSLTLGGSIEVTEDMLYMNSSEFTAKTVYGNFEKNGYDKADIYLNVNAQGYLALNSSENNTYELNVFRNWMALSNSTSNTGAALPDVHYTVISSNGGESDVVTITPNSKNSCVATVTANKAGTAIILVTYDAMSNADGLGGTQFSAIWPENTGVIVVSVDENSGTITTNMTLNETVNTAYSKTAIDAEHDILFYVGDNGAEYSFKPENGCTVTVARSTVGTSMTFNGFTDSNIVTADDGTVTVKGLTTGTHIIKVTKGDAVTYQVIRARKASYTLTGSDGKIIDKDNPAEAGEQVTVKFSGLISPMEKLFGIYNCNFGFYYNGQDDTNILVKGGYYGVYDFSGNANRQVFKVTIPESWNAVSYTLSDGAIRVGGFGSFAGAHRSVTYAAGKAQNNNALELNGFLGSLPDIVIPTVSYNVRDFESAVDALPTNITLADKDAVEAARAKYTALTQDEKASVDAEKLAKLETAEDKIASLEKAKAFDDAVNALPSKDKLTLSDESKVTAAREMYKALSNDEKTLVKANSLTKLTSLEQRIDDLKAAKAVDDIVNALPAEDKVEISDKTKVTDAKTKYNALTSEQKTLVASTSMEKLEKLEKVIADKEAAKAVDDKIDSIDMSASDKAVNVAKARADYNALTESQKKFVTKLETLEGYEARLTDEEKAAAVDELIDEIAPPITLGSKESVRRARKAYDDLTPAQKNLVENYADLESAENELSALLIQQVEDLINALPEKDEITLNDKESIEEARVAYDELTDDEQKEISKDTLKKLTDAEKAYEKLVPKTGDSSNVIAYGAVLMLSIVAFMGVVICRKKKSM